MNYVTEKMVNQDYKVFIGNIPYDCRENDIHHFFRGYGRIKEVKLKILFYERIILLLGCKNEHTSHDLIIYQTTVRSSFTHVMEFHLRRSKIKG